MYVDVMNELMYDTLVRYFKTLAHTGYKSYDVVFKMLVIDFIYEITHTELIYYITNKDIKLMQDLLYQFLGSTCEISFPTNNRPCCVCICCNGGNSTPPPVITPTTTTSTPRPNKKMYIRNSSDNIGLEVSGGKIIDSSSSVILAGGNLEMSYIDKITPLYIEGYGTSIDNISSIRIIDNKGGTIPVEETSSAGVFRTTSSLYSLIEENDITFIDIKVTKQVDTTTTTSSTPTPITTTTTTSTSTTPPTTTATSTKYPSISLTNSTNQTLFLTAPIVDGRDYQDLPVGGTAYIKQDDSVQTISLSDSMLDMKNADIIIRVYTAESSYEFYQFEKKEDVIEIDFATLISNKNITRVVIEGTINFAPTTTTKPHNAVYYGVIKGYMDPNSFCSIPINELIDRSETKFKSIIGDSVNEFTIPQDGYFSYLIIPVDKVELQYAAFTSGGLTSTYYDSSKPNTPIALDPTPNGAYYSKYTRGGTAPYNKGGNYKGIDYDVYFAYINSGSIPEMINIRAKNK